ncbi:MAG: ABC transporter permease, partial [Vicinamibacterales bacterium]
QAGAGQRLRAKERLIMKLYRALLRLYPASFRAEYGDEMCAVFARDLKARGAAAWLAAIADTAVNATRVHLDITRQDLRYAIRSLGRTPGFTFTTIVVAALGIGATTAAFSIADHVLLRPLPFPRSDRLVKLWENQSSRGYSRMELSPPNYLDWQRMSTSFDGMSAYTGLSANLVGVGDPERLDGTITTGGFFRVLGRPAAIGRVLTEADARDQAQRAVVISDALWRVRFGADPNVLGRTVMLNDESHVIVGVMPPDFFFPGRESMFWRPIYLSEQNGDVDRNNNYLRVVARLKDGVSFEQARSEMAVIADRLEREYPRENAETGATVVRLRDELSQQPRLLIVALVGAALCVLLIACTNLANLLLSRALSRRGEFAVRAAIGAGVDRLVRQMLTESLLLAVCGGVLGVLIALVAGPLVARLVPTALPIAEVPPMDLRMLGVAAALTFATGVAFGLVPAIRVGRTTDSAALKEGARGGSGRSTERLRSGLVIAEISASVVLLVASGLLIQALLRVQHVDPGFKADNVLTLRTTLPRPKYDETVRRNEFYQRVVSEVQALPGVTRAAYISFLPMVMRGGIWPVLLDIPSPQRDERIDPADPRATTRASLRFVTPGFFETVSAPILSGRDVRETDTYDSPFVAVVSQSFATEHYPGEDPLGRTFAIGLSGRTIVGVVGDIRVRGLERESEPQVYVPSTQVRDGALAFYAPQDLVIRASVPVSTLIPSVRSIVGKIDAQLPIASVQLLSDVVAAETAPRVTQVRVLAAFAAVALVLAAIGIHGLLAFSVSARVREIGVRMALGASAADILRIVVMRSVFLAAAGVGLGAAAAYAVGRSMQALLAGVAPADTTVFAVAIAISIMMTIAGSLVPALRAVRVDPLAATRAE